MPVNCNLSGVRITELNTIWKTGNLFSCDELSLALSCVPQVHCVNFHHHMNRRIQWCVYLFLLFIFAYVFVRQMENCRRFTSILVKERLCAATQSIRSCTNHIWLYHCVVYVLLKYRGFMQLTFVVPKVKNMGKKDVARENVTVLDNRMQLGWTTI